MKHICEIDENNTIVWAADYMPFGEVDITVETLENNFRFPGQYYDTETEISYNWFRYYHSKIGRYLRSDPVGLDAVKNKERSKFLKLSDLANI